MDKISGYIECEIGGQIRPIKFGMGAWKIFTEITGKSLDEMGSINWMEFSGSIIFAGLKQAALVNSTPIDFNEAEVMNWLDEINDETYKSIMRTLAESKVLGRTFKDMVQAQSEPETVKKKVSSAT